MTGPLKVTWKQKGELPSERELHELLEAESDHVLKQRAEAAASAIRRNMKRSPSALLRQNTDKVIVSKVDGAWVVSVSGEIQEEIQKVEFGTNRVHPVLIVRGIAAMEKTNTSEIRQQLEAGASKRIRSRR